MVGITRETKLQKGGSKVVCHRTYKQFNQELFISDLQAVDRSVVCGDNNPDSSLNRFMDILMRIVDKHAPLRKSTVRIRCAPWLDTDLKELMHERDKDKKKNQTVLVN